MSLATFPTVVVHSPSLPQSLRWTVTEFHELRGEPKYESRNLILVEGQILEMPKPNPAHDAAVLLTEIALRKAFGEGHCIRVQMALVLGLSTDPVPDVSVVIGSPRDYTDHPRTAMIVVEVADSSLAYDTRDKANLFAASGIQDYWVVDLVHRKAIIFRDPTRDPIQAFGAAYRSRLVVDAADSVAPLAAPQTPIAVGDLLP
jgi:Uma2 family endonuclease